MNKKTKKLTCENKPIFVKTKNSHIVAFHEK